MKIVFIIVAALSFWSCYEPGGASSLDPNDPCPAMLLHPSKGINDHLESLDKKQAAQHFFRAFKNINQNPKIVISEEINYMKWFILTLNYLDNYDFMKHDKYFMKFLELNHWVVRINYEMEFHNGEYKGIKGLGSDEYLLALKRLIEGVNNDLSLKLNGHFDVDFHGMEAGVAKDFNIKNLVDGVFWSMLLAESSVRTTFADNFLKWSQEQWFEVGFSSFARKIKALPSASEAQRGLNNLSFIKEKFQNLVDRVEGPSKLKEHFVSKKVLDKKLKKLSDDIVILYNNDGFESGEIVLLGANNIRGQKIEIDGVKTGYNIYFPKKITENSTLIVHVYGGCGAFEKDKDFSPRILAPHLMALLDAGMYVGELNLPDRLELNYPQNQMDEATHTKIHKSIDNFFQVVSGEPRKLLGDNQVSEEIIAHVNRLKTLPKYIFGASFGGRTAVRHLQLFPDSFDGAISHDGGLNVRSKKTYLWPMIYIDDLKQKVLLLHNIDDARVNVSTSISFYAAAIGMNKNAELYLSLQGNPVELSHGLLGLSFKGHFFPTRPDRFHSYGQKIVEFVQGKSRSEEEIDTQTRLLAMVQEGNYWKTNYDPFWYLLKETIFFRVKEQNKRHQIRSYVSELVKQLK